jgi:murein DD-endopeptidase MepM/ murein hydrolase activator NlpD
VTLLTGKKLLKCFLVAVLSLSVVFSCSAGTVSVSASSLSNLQKKQTNLKKQQEQIKTNLSKLKNDTAKKQQYKNELDAQITNVQQQIDTLDEQIEGYNADIKDREEKIAGKQKDIDADYERLKERIRALYLTGDASTMEIVLNAKNVMDLADKMKIMSVVTEHDSELIDRLKNEMNSIKADKQAIESERSRVTATKNEYAQKRSELAALETEAKKTLSELASNTADEQKEYQKNAAAQKQLQQQVDAWYKAYYASLKSKSSGGGGSGGYVSKGHFTWPVPGYTQITSPYGWRWNHTDFHPGIDIGGGGIYGSKIVAADSGRVIMAGYGFSGSGYNGYGNVVAIDHGGGYSTLYGHMSRVAVSNGQQVTKGQIIGYVGSTGHSTGPHCHFEIRVNGQRQNPMNSFG